MSTVLIKQKKNKKRKEKNKKEKKTDGKLNKVKQIDVEEFKSAVIKDEKKEQSEKDIGTTHAEVRMLISEKKGWYCPITKNPFNEPYIFGDGITYEKDALIEWIEKNKTNLYGPTGKKILSYVYGLNKTLYNHINYENMSQYLRSEDDMKLQCQITKKPFKFPVILVSKFNKFEEVEAKTYEAAALIEGLRVTWGNYSIALSETYLKNQSHNILDLSLTHLLIPNLILWKNYNVQLPTLPSRPPAPQFNEFKLTHTLSHINIDDDFEHKYTPSFTEGSINIFVGLKITNSTLNCHGKLYKFKNCKFVDCTFDNICWCGIQFYFCKFVNCIFSDCRGINFAYRNMLNCEYKDNLIVSLRYSSLDMQNTLLGTQTNSSNIELVKQNLRCIEPNDLKFKEITYKHIITEHDYKQNLVMMENHEMRNISKFKYKFIQFLHTKMKNSDIFSSDMAEVTVKIIDDYKKNKFVHLYFPELEKECIFEYDHDWVQQNVSFRKKSQIIKFAEYSRLISFSE